MSFLLLGVENIGRSSVVANAVTDYAAFLPVASGNSMLALDVNSNCFSTKAQTISDYLLVLQVSR